MRIRRPDGLASARIVVALVTALLAAGAYLADVRAGWDSARIAVDIGTGVGLVALSMAGRSVWDRVGCAAVGLTWLAGSLIPELANAHRAAMVLFVVGGSLPRHGRRGGLLWLALGAAALALSTPAVGPWWGAALFGALALIQWGVPRTVRSAPAAGSLVLLAAAEAFIAVAAGEVALNSGALRIAQITYALALLSGAAWVLTVARQDQAFLDGLAPEESLWNAADPFAVATALLQQSLGDDSLQVRPATPRERPDSEVDRGRMVLVEGLPWARVAAGTSILDDEPTWRAVEAAVARIGLHTHLVAQEGERARAVELSRGRLLDAADRERALIGAGLGEEVVRPLTHCATQLAEWPHLAVELRGTASDVSTLLGGIAPVHLGEGRLTEAVRGLCARCPVPVDLAVAGSPTGSTQVEVTAYAVVAEGLANVLKHSGALSAEVHLHHDPPNLVVVVVDEGRGGADPTGSGLLGLGDRVSALGGTLLVTGSPRGGTTLTARLPSGTRAGSP